jgi:hypothetical protein
MARYTPPPPPAPAIEEPVDVNRVRNYEAYRARLTAINWNRTRPEYGNKKQLALDWELVDIGGELRDFLGLSLGQQQNGGISKLRQLLNALGGQPEAAEIYWFNDEEGDERGQNPLAWGYEPNDVPYMTLQEWQEVQVRGRVVERSDGKGYRYKIEVYEAPEASSVGAGVARQTATPAPARAAAETGQRVSSARGLTSTDPSDEIPF